MIVGVDVEQHQSQTRALWEAIRISVPLTHSSFYLNIKAAVAV